MFERAFVFVSLLFLSLVNLFSFTVYLFSVRHTIFHVVTAEGQNHCTHTMRRIAPWRYTILSQVLSPNSSTSASDQSPTRPNPPCGVHVFVYSC